MNFSRSLSLKIGAVTFLLWGILHIWVGYEGLSLYLTGDLASQWHLLVGGRNMPFDQVQLPSSAAMIEAQRHLILNFCLDVSGYGFLGVAVAWMLWTYRSMFSFLLGLFIIGLGDLSFLFLMVTPGIIEPNIPTISGPILWFIACGFTAYDLFVVRPRTLSAA